MASSTSKEAEKVKPVLTINELGDTLKDPEVLDKFRETLRALDGKSKAAPSVKGRFERYLDFVLEMQALYNLPQSDEASLVQGLVIIRSNYFTCPPTQKLSITSQVALKAFSEHLKALEEAKVTKPDLELSRPVFEDAYRKLQQKHDVFKKNYKPSMNLHALLCLLS